VQDFSWWSGLTVADARAGLEAARTSLDAARTSLEPSTFDGKTYWGPPVPVGARGISGRASSKTVRLAAPLVHLLPNYDEHVVAYRDHAPSLDPATREALRTRGNEPLAVHLIARDGLVVGRWKRALERTRAVVTTQLLTPLKHPEKGALMQAAAAFGRFLGMPVQVEPL
jgi:hypothetical protein